MQKERQLSAVKGTSVPNDWTEIKEIEFWNNTEYRVKPEPEYRPFKDAKECWAEMQKHQPFGWTKLIGAIEYSFITDVDDNTNYSGAILPTTNVDKYYNYLKELGFEISLRYKGEYGVYVVWC